MREGWQSGTSLRERRSNGKRECVVILLDLLDCGLVVDAVLIVCEKGKRARLDSAAAAAAAARQDRFFREVKSSSNTNQIRLANLAAFLYPSLV